MMLKQLIEQWANLLNGKELNEAILPEDVKNAKKIISVYYQRLLDGDEIDEEEYLELKNHVILTALSDKKTKPNSLLAIQIVHLALSMLVPPGLVKMVY